MKGNEQIHEEIKNRLRALSIPTFSENVFEWEQLERALRPMRDYGHPEEELQEKVAAEMARNHAPKTIARKSKWASARALNHLDDDEIGSSING